MKLCSLYTILYYTHNGYENKVCLTWEMTRSFHVSIDIISHVYLNWRSETRKVESYSIYRGDFCDKYWRTWFTFAPFHPAEIMDYCVLIITYDAHMYVLHGVRSAHFDYRHRNASHSAVDRFLAATRPASFQVEIPSLRRSFSTASNYRGKKLPIRKSLFVHVRTVTFIESRIT